MLNSRQRAYLRSLANGLEDVFQIGKSGITSSMEKDISACLEARELIKVKVLDNCELDAREAGHELAGAIEADVVQVIGNKFVLYRESKENSKIQLPK
ncbi:ribosome assembly RNA-binding protein YhbY [Lutispora saccharofermentans]|uniref:Ribosome assembly RNA-binding protein YhbY n=1 Tax=Lutispora saccharofermentans TaxID=3024236 RepID=A0ABT1NB27_9FIRM|nr:ribosome assembly RNA-binding protein YhbY [Lutispora saccharofermentans]MCQ1528455.1 ribosome assembly RNA-binding protein YhbY [Lutispora saccharofermentans]